MKLPIFQMVYGQDDQGRIGLLFPSEVEENTYSSILFALPVLLPYKPFYGITGYLNENEFYFPAVINGEYDEIKAQIDFPNIIFNVPTASIDIAFNIEFPPFFPPPQLRKDQLYSYYIGKNPLFRDKAFLELSPISILAMNDLFTDEKIAFVGYTPNFGEINRRYFQSNF